MTFLDKIKKPYLVLAPMAGYTESPFRRLIREIEPSTVLVSELISAEALRRRNEKTFRMCEFHPDEKNMYGVQLFGSETSAFVDAAQIVEEMGADFIDINLGCPSPKVINSGHGSALLKNPNDTANMIGQLIKSTKLPVTVKMRLGFYDDSALVDTAKRFQDAGVQWIAVHGRTTKQRFTGDADWDPIYDLKKNIDIPIIGNGDVTSAAIAGNRIQNLDGIMIGRAAMRNPWIFSQTRAVLDGAEIPPKPPLKAQLEFFQRHAHLATDMKGERMAMIELRKHFAHFMRGFRGASGYRDRLIRVESIDELDVIFGEIIAGLD